MLAPVSALDISEANLLLLW